MLHGNGVPSAPRLIVEFCQPCGNRASALQAEALTEFRATATSSTTEELSKIL